MLVFFWWPCLSFRKCYRYMRHEGNVIIILCVVSVSFGVILSLLVVTLILIICFIFSVPPALALVQGLGT